MVYGNTSTVSYTARYFFIFFVRAPLFLLNILVITLVGYKVNAIILIIHSNALHMWPYRLG